jgi:hypothetical protein
MEPKDTVSASLYGGIGDHPLSPKGRRDALLKARADGESVTIAAPLAKDAAGSDLTKILPHESLLKAIQSLPAGHPDRLAAEAQVETVNNIGRRRQQLAKAVAEAARLQAAKLAKG